MELDAASISLCRSGRLIMHVNKVHHVTTINRLAKDLGENAFTDFGIENLIDLIKIHKDDPTLLKRSGGDN